MGSDLPYLTCRSGRHGIRGRVFLPPLLFAFATRLSPNHLDVNTTSQAKPTLNEPDYSLRLSPPRFLVLDFHCPRSSLRAHQLPNIQPRRYPKPANTMGLVFLESRNDALNINGPQIGDQTLTTNGSNWLWTVTAIYLLSFVRLLLVRRFVGNVLCCAVLTPPSSSSVFSPSALARVNVFSTTYLPSPFSLAPSPTSPKLPVSRTMSSPRRTSNLEVSPARSTGPSTFFGSSPSPSSLSLSASFPAYLGPP